MYEGSRSQTKSFLFFVVSFKLQLRCNNSTMSEMYWDVNNKNDDYDDNNGNDDKDNDDVNSDSDSIDVN